MGNRIRTTLLLAAWGEKGNRSRVTFNLSVMLIMCLVVILGIALDLAGLSMLHLFMLLSFLVWVTWLALHQVLFTGAIDGNKILGAVCIYILLGLIWALLYLFIAETVPTAARASMRKFRHLSERQKGATSKAA